MKNKSLLLKLWVLLVSVVGFWTTFTSATFFHLHIDSQTVLSETEMTKNIMPIHFADNWNDFGWFFYFKALSGVETETPETTTNYSVEIVGKTKYECEDKIRWYYYNAERWERLRPLDEDTEKVWNITWSHMEGWLYTICAIEWYKEAKNACYADWATTRVQECEAAVNSEYKADQDGYYWWIKHVFSWQTMVLVSWVEYENNTPFVTIKSDSDISPTFFRLKNEYPVWFIYDHNWWLWVVWCKVIDHKVGDIIANLWSPVDLKNVFELSANKDKIEPKAPFSSYMDCSISDSNIVWDSRLWLIIEWIVWLSDEDKLWYIWNEEDEKMQYFSTVSVNNKTLINYVKKKAEILCRWKWDNYNINKDSIICVSSTSPSIQPEKTYVFKKSVTIGAQSSCNKNSIQNNGGYYNIFVLWWDLTISEWSAGCVFSGDWFTTNNSVNDFSWAVSANPDAYNWSKWVAAWLYLKGNFIVDWHIKWTSTDNKLDHKYFVYWKLSSKDDFEELKKTFSWKCNNWIATDDTYCPDSLYQYASLVVIDQNYPSAFINS